EPDDFGMDDLPALTRLVHWAGLLGSRVLLSSATLPPALVEGLFLAYRAGREVFQQHRSQQPGEPVNVCCLWVDEFQQAAQDCADGAAFRAQHIRYVEKRVAQLAKTEVRRLARIAALPPEWAGMNRDVRRVDFAQYVLQRAWELHQQSQNHSTVSSGIGSGKRVSFGLIRMANIDPLFDVALAMYRLGAPASGVRVHLCMYHSQFPLLARSAIERQLDAVLNRRPARDGADPALQQPTIRALIEASPEADQMFIVLGSPVTEVGRDHDYDWAVVEPSSMRSLIQLAGRVRRHRPGQVAGVNMAVLDSNLREYERSSSDKAAFCKPGFETDDAPFHLKSHAMRTLMAREMRGGDAWVVDAQPRIALAPGNLFPSRYLVDLEHARMHDCMLPRPEGTPTPTHAASLHWHHPGHLWLTGLLPQYQRFRYDPQRRDDVALLPDDDEEKLLLHRVENGPRRSEKQYVRVDESMCTPVPKSELASPSVSPWPAVNLMDELAALAQARGLSLPTCAERYATASLPHDQNGWWFDEALGFTVKK
ncbi:MAG TPA: type I-F CRISPR-associated helicase Cas3, partial [Burkholderiaceae bacterium]